jgi:hypothetical protein
MPFAHLQRVLTQLLAKRRSLLKSTFVHSPKSHAPKPNYPPCSVLELPKSKKLLIERSPSHLLPHHSTLHAKDLEQGSRCCHSRGFASLHAKDLEQGSRRCHSRGCLHAKDLEQGSRRCHSRGCTMQREGTHLEYGLYTN